MPRKRVDAKEDLFPLNLMHTPSQKKRWQTAADKMTKRLGLVVSLSAFLRKAADECAEKERVLSEQTRIRRVNKQDRDF